MPIIRRPPAARAITKDSDAERICVWDWNDAIAADAAIVMSTWRITGPDAALTYDFPSIGPGGRQTQVRLRGGTVGRTYAVTNRYTTNTTPATTDEGTIAVRIVDR